MFIFFFVLFVSIFFFCVCFLEWEPLKSCLCFSFGVLLMSFYFSFGLYVWYSYFVVLVFLSGVMSLMSYLCSLVNYGFYVNCYSYFFVFVFFVLLFFVDFDYYDYLYFDCDFFLLGYDFYYLFVFWLVFILLLFLCLISFVFDSYCCLRGL
uniref:NADH dehydrogenase subunit 6 n=1 Tax=Tetrameres grusi TaxID=1911024 RepID=UPI001FCDEAFE|nr:NADH dehydrogenase subunit 6 [Tetrameres grusi]UNY39747.1 NADH dehydrogenase subunit 6 [Tetrameres grusi]